MKDRDSMLERMIAFLKDIPRPSGTARPMRVDDPRIAVAALMYHVMDADGVRQDVEWDRIKQLLSESYGIEGRELDQLVQAGEAADHEAIDLYAFTSVLMRHLDEQARIDFIRLMWDVVYADGELHELEDNTLWRVSELLGVDSRDRVLARQQAARRALDTKGNADE
jgi:uncharacterized tellurite resistance protein B-like protein